MRWRAAAPSEAREPAPCRRDKNAPLEWRALSPEGLRGLTNVTFYALFPALLFRSMSKVRIEALSFDILFVFFGTSLLLFFAGLPLARTLGMKLGEGTVFALSSVFSNGVGIGIPFISYAFGDAR